MLVRVGVVFVGIFLLGIECHGRFNTLDGVRQLVARDDPAFGKSVVEWFARGLENGKCMLGEHEDFGGGLGMKDDQHDQIPLPDFRREPLR